MNWKAGCLAGAGFPATPQAHEIARAAYMLCEPGPPTYHPFWGKGGPFLCRKAWQGAHSLLAAPYSASG